MQAVVFDGQLVNSKELITAMGLKSLPTDSDAVIVSELYSTFGLHALNKLDGHYAFGILDGEKLILGRDPLGVRPLYYGFSNGAFLFASEIKALVGICPSIRAVPCGSLLTSDQGIVTEQCISPGPTEFADPEDWISRLGVLLTEAVESCAPSSVPIGIWLSGGVDSSVVATLAKEKFGSVHTFSAGIEGAPDLKYAEKVAKYLGTQHRARRYELKEALKILDDVIFHLESFDAPLVRSAIGNYLVAELAAECVPFVFSGEGGDELFAGYAYQKDCESDTELTLSVQDAVAALHNTALQRVDRSSAAHHTHVGLPLLHPRLVRFALAMPSSLKIGGPRQIEKWPLRQALVDNLPPEIIWRRKAKFWEGAGTADLLTQYAEDRISDSDFIAERELGLNGRIRSKEELLYYRVYRSHFGDQVPISEIGRTEHV
jgi:asparagine synthase (glutamine-hydrolysing)